MWKLYKEKISCGTEIEQRRQHTTVCACGSVHGVQACSASRVSLCAPQDMAWYGGRGVGLLDSKLPPKGDLGPKRLKDLQKIANAKEEAEPSAKDAGAR
eukprot:5010781-Prymnesium_polylepis.1